MRLRLSPITRSILLVLVFVPDWSTSPRLPLYAANPRLTAQPVVLFPNAPTKRRLGGLVFERGYRLRSTDPAFGGFSSLLVEGDRFTLLSDGGNFVRFRLDARGTITDPHFAALPTGPGSGWDKSDRDSESMTRDPVTGTIWVGFEHGNAIWAYTPGLVRSLRHAAPKAMAKWPGNGGAEAMVRRRDGSFVALSETGYWRGIRWHDYVGIYFDGDPSLPSRRGFRFVYRPPLGYNPTDMAELPDGRLLVLNRRFTFRDGFWIVLNVIDPHQIAPGKRVSGRTIARFAPPVTTDNFEGIAVVREANGGTGIWITSDDNESSFQRTLLLKFRIDDAPGRSPAP